MCIIAIKVRGVELPKEEHLRNCETRNKDGIGVAYIKAGTEEITIKKDFLNVDTFIAWFYENIKAEDVAVIHYRFATHGLVDNGNRHPFPITKNKEMLRQENVVCQMAVAHNGVISQYGEHKKFSDTQKFILDILSDDAIKSNITNPAVQKLVSYYLGSDRLAVLLKDGTIFTWGSWEKEGSIFYSNDGYKDKKIEWGESLRRFYDKRYKVQGDIEEEAICDNCGDFTNDLRPINAGKKYGYFNLCKDCRKLHGKGKIDFEELLSRSLEEEDEGEGNTTKDMTALEKLALTEQQCESCLDWYEKGEMSNYAGGLVCQNCMDAICQLPKGKYEKAK